MLYVKEVAHKVFGTGHGISAGYEFGQLLISERGLFVGCFDYCVFGHAVIYCAVGRGQIEKAEIRPLPSNITPESASIGVGVGTTKFALLIGQCTKIHGPFFANRDFLCMGRQGKFNTSGLFNFNYGLAEFGEIVA